MASSKLQAIWNHPAGPKTIHFWGPTFKWGLSIANVADFSKPPDHLSYPQQIGTQLSVFGRLDVLTKIPVGIGPGLPEYDPTIIRMFLMASGFAAVSVSGLIWTRYGTVITPKNWNLVSVNFAMALTGMYQISRKLRQDLSPNPEDAAAEE